MLIHFSFVESLTSKVGSSIGENFLFTSEYRYDDRPKLNRLWAPTYGPIHIVCLLLSHKSRTKHMGFFLPMVSPTDRPSTQGQYLTLSIYNKDLRSDYTKHTGESEKMYDEVLFMYLHVSIVV